MPYFFIIFSIFFFTGCFPDNISNNDKIILPSDILNKSVVLHDNEGCIQPNSITATNSNKMLVILINYTNQTISSQNSVWRDKIFGKNSHQLNDYYLESSSNKFEFSQANEEVGCVDDGVVAVKLNKEHPNTDVDSERFEYNTYPDLKMALQVVDEYINFSNYDSDENGHITPDELLLTYIIAGYEDSYEGNHVTNGIWAHQYCMANSANIPLLDGVTLMGCQNQGNFALFGELHNIYMPHDATIGIIAHELGHSAFSLPDLYNTSNPNIGGIGYFGLMGSGLWTFKDNEEYAGETPVHFSAWSKVFNGWVTPTEDSGSTSLHESASNNYNVIKLPINADEYYLIENRNNSGYDKGLYILDYDDKDGPFNGGMAIWHINENKLTSYYLDNNTVNAETSDKGVDLVEAANESLDDGGIGHEKALFYYLNVDSYTNNETVITNISERNSTMTLNIN